MSYKRVIILRKGIGGSWCLYSQTGHQLTDDRYFGNRGEAVQWANAWISSWQAVTLVIEDEQKS